MKILRNSKSQLKFHIPYEKKNVHWTVVSNKLLKLTAKILIALQDNIKTAGIKVVHQACE